MPRDEDGRIKRFMHRTCRHLTTDRRLRATAPVWGERPHCDRLGLGRAAARVLKHLRISNTCVR